MATFTSPGSAMTNGIHGLFTVNQFPKVDYCPPAEITKLVQDDTETCVDDIIKPFDTEIALTKDPFISQILQGDEKTVELSCNDPSLTHRRDKDGNSLLMAVAKLGKTYLLNSLISLRVYSITQRSKSGATALHHAAVNNKREAIEWLVSHGADISAEDNDGRTPVFVSAFEGHAEVVELLVKNGNGDVNAKDKYGRTALMAAAQQGHVNVVRKLVELDADVMCTSNGGKTALFYACLEKHANVVEVLGKQNEQLLNHKETGGETVVMKCAASGDLGMIKLLRSLGASIDMKDKRGLTALMTATEKEQTEVVQYLVKKCKNKNEQNDKGHTALHLAASGSHFKVLEVLLKEGLDVNVGDQVGDTPLILATQKGSMECVQLLLENNASIDKQNNALKTALIEAVLSNQSDIAKLLHTNGASADMTCNSGTSAKDFASVSNNMSIREYFSKLDKVKTIFLAVEVEAFDTVQKPTYDVNVRNAAGFTLLMIAAGKGSLRIVKYLCNHGAVINAQTNEGKTALACAVSNGHLDVLDFLIGRGAHVNESEGLGKDVISIYRNAHQNLCKAGTKTHGEISEGTGLLHFASYHGHAGIVRYVLQKKLANPNVPDTDGKTPLMCASECGDKKIAEILIEHGASLNDRDKTCGSTALIYASRSGNIHIMQLLLKYDLKVDAIDEGGRNAIHHCTSNVSAEASAIVALLVGKGADINHRDVNEQTPLIECCQYGNIHLAETLLRLNADTSVVSRYGVNALQEACLVNHCELVAILLRASAWPIDTLKMCMHYALVNDFKDLISRMRTCGITVAETLGSLLTDVILSDDFTEAVWTTGTSGVQMKNSALTSFVSDIKQLPNTVMEQVTDQHLQGGHYEVVNMLNDHGALPSRTEMYIVWDEQKSTLIIEACKKNDLKTLKELYSTYGCVRDDKGKTLLMVSVEAGFLKTVQYLVNKGVNVNDVDTDKTSALKLAVSKRHNGIVKYLLAHGADPNVTDKHGCTPLHRACHLENFDAVKLLIQYKADVNARETRHNYSPLEVTLIQPTQSTKIALCLLHSGADVSELKNSTNKDINKFLCHPEVEAFLKETTMRKEVTHERKKVKEIPRKDLDIERAMLGTKLLKGSYRGTPVVIKVFDRIPKGEQLKFVAYFDEVKLPVLDNNIVRLLGYSQGKHEVNKHSMNIVFEFVNGLNLHQLIFNGPDIEQSRKLSVASQCYNGLAHLHNNDISHGYIEPSSIMVSSGTWMVKIITRYEPESLTSSRHQTGTVSYGAPEIILQNRCPNKASDVWAMGVTICELFIHDTFWRNCTDEYDIKKEMRAEDPVHRHIEKICVQFPFDEVKLVCNSLQIKEYNRPPARYIAEVLAQLCKSKNPF